ncbi:MAG: hypothetical protein QOI38_64 [Sphingomonadales bacterium]|nr:hypothetical protein [Sphingomonadales bacterium]
MQAESAVPPSDRRKWPPHCCVPAYVHAALAGFGVSVETPSVLPSLLGVHVGPNDENPLGLPVTSDDSVRGMTASGASKAVPELLKALGSPLSFRHVRFNEIPFALYEDILRAALESRVASAAGVKWSAFDRSPGASDALHLLRVTSFDGGMVSLFDDSRECEPPEMKRPWQELESAVLAAADGFWFIGSKADLNHLLSPIYRGSDTA